MSLKNPWVDHLVACLLLLVAVSRVSAAAPQMNQSLPSLQILERGEMFLEDDEISYLPWSTENGPGKVHIIQCFNGTLRDSKIFEPFTDRLKAAYNASDFHVSTIINLDAALWGTTGFVVSQVKKNKRRYPDATLVLDKYGRASERWELGEEGAILLIVDRAGVVRYLARESLSEPEMQAALELVGEQILNDKGS